MGLAALGLAACSSVPPAYKVSFENNKALERYRNVQFVHVHDFVAPPEFSAMCRGAIRIEAPRNTTFHGYITDALRSELNASGMLSEVPVVDGLEIKGEIESIEFSSAMNLSSGFWKIRLNLENNFGKRAVVEEVYVFESALEATDACRLTALEFPNAVQATYKRLFTSEVFPSLLAKSSTPK